MTRMTPRRGVLLIALAAVLWGTVGIAVQLLYTSSDASAISLGFHRLALSVPALALTLLVMQGKQAFRLRVRDLRRMALMGVMLASYQLCYFAAIARVGVSVATLITLCTAPAMVAVLAGLFLRERLYTRTLVALVLAMLGTLLLVGFQSAAAQNATTPQPQVGLGVLLALGSAFGYAVVVLVSRSLATGSHPLQTTTVAFACGALTLLPFALISGLTVTFSMRGWATLLYLGLVPTGLAYVLFVIGMRSTPATAASVVTLLEPLTATLLAWTLFGEALGASGVFGGVLLMSALLLLAKGPPTPPTQPPQGP